MVEIRGIWDRVNNYSDDKKDTKKKNKKHEKSHHKRPRSASEESSKASEKKKKVVANSVGEIIEGSYEIKTLYQLVIALVMANQPSMVVKRVKDTIGRVEFVNKVRTVRKLALELQAPDYNCNNKAILTYTLESIYASLPNFLSFPSSQPYVPYIPAELALILVRYQFLDFLVPILVNNPVKRG